MLMIMDIIMMMVMIIIIKRMVIIMKMVMILSFFAYKNHETTIWPYWCSLSYIFLKDFFYLICWPWGFLLLRPLLLCMHHPKPKFGSCPKIWINYILVILGFHCLKSYLNINQTVSLTGGSSFRRRRRMINFETKS